MDSKPKGWDRVWDYWDCAETAVGRFPPDGWLQPLKYNNNDSLQHNLGVARKCVSTNRQEWTHPCICNIPHSNPR